MNVTIYCGIDKQRVGVSVITAFLLLLSACQGNASGSQEINILYTAGAETVVSHLTEVAAKSTPEPGQIDTPISPDLLSPSIPTVTPGSSINLTLSPISGTLENPNISTMDLATETLEIDNRPDRCQWVEQDPPDNATIAANTGFTTTWVLQNFGTSTWNKHYQAVWYNANGSDRIGPGQPVTYNLTNDVAPNEVYRLKVEMQASLKPGKYYTLWGLQNSSGATFCTFDLTINVK